jgi:hypothetical protein
MLTHANHTLMLITHSLVHNTALVVGSPLQSVETQNLRTLGALQSTFLLPASEALASKHAAPHAPYNAITHESVSHAPAGSRGK